MKALDAINGSGGLKLTEAGRGNIFEYFAEA